VRRRDERARADERAGAIGSRWPSARRRDGNNVANRVDAVVRPPTDNFARDRFDRWRIGDFVGVVARTATRNDQNRKNRETCFE
jgi:hypothetical protein